jgi:hypothetical protein
MMGRLKIKHGGLWLPADGAGGNGGNGGNGNGDAPTPPNFAAGYPLAQHFDLAEWGGENNSWLSAGGDFESGQFVWASIETDMYPSQAHATFAAWLAGGFPDPNLRKIARYNRPTPVQVYDASGQLVTISDPEEPAINHRLSGGLWVPSGLMMTPDTFFVINGVPSTASTGASHLISIRQASGGTLLRRATAEYHNPSSDPFPEPQMLDYRWELADGAAVFHNMDGETYLTSQDVQFPALMMANAGSPLFAAVNGILAEGTSYGVAIGGEIDPAVLIGGFTGELTGFALWRWGVTSSSDMTTMTTPSP